MCGRGAETGQPSALLVLSLIFDSGWIMVLIGLGLDEPEERCASEVQPDQVVHDLQVDCCAQLAGLVRPERGGEGAVPGFKALFYAQNIF